MMNDFKFKSIAIELTVANGGTYLFRNTKNWQIWF